MHYKDADIYPETTSFQYQMVRLMHDDRAHWEQVYEFQYQYGAIDAEFCKNDHGLSNWFQYQYGAIDTIAMFLKIFPETSFNTNMVRLMHSFGEG